MAEIDSERHAEKILQALRADRQARPIVEGDLKDPESTRRELGEEDERLAEFHA